MRVRALRLGTIVATGVLTFASLGCRHEEPRDGIPNVRLGMAPRDVRERFVSGGEGSWQTALGSGDDTVLEWTSRNPSASVRQARFEFHLGMLVAIRATTAEAASNEKISLTPKTVTARAPHEGGTSVTVLARDCPTHKDEAEGLAARSR